MPPLTSVGNPGPPLHSFVPPLIGRDDDTRALLDLLDAQEHRLITLTGPGGVGKTSLAYEVARSATDRFENNVFVVQLAPIRDASIIGFLIANVLGSTASPDKPLSDQIAERLEGRPTLLVLDNFEHLIENAGFVAIIVNRCPGLTVLATSRTRLNLLGEFVFNVASLPTSTPGTADPTLAPAVRLFIERCCHFDQSFAVDDQNLAEVTTLCEMLDGLPLAIELAAGRIRTLTPKQMISRTVNQLDLLAGNTRDLPVRQRSMRGTITWSVDLLDEATIAVLRRLSVFAGGFTLDFASTIAGADLRVMQELVDHHLVQPVTHVWGQRRFLMNEVIRQFAFDSLAAAHEDEEILQRHADTFLSAMEALDSLPRYARFHEEFEELRPEADNLRIAIGWFLDTDQPEAAARLLHASFSILWQHPYTEYMTWLARVANVFPADGDADIRCDLLRSIGFSSAHLGRHAEAANASTEAIRLARTIGDPDRLANCLLTEGRVHLRNGSYSESARSLLEARSIVEANRRTDILAYVLGDLGTAEMLQGDFDQAEVTLQEALRLHRDATERGQAAGALHYLAYIAAYRNEFGSARSYAQEALDLLRNTSEHEQLVVRHLQARVELLGGEHGSASTIMREVLDRRLVIGDAAWLNLAIAQVALLATRIGQFELAARLFGFAGTKSVSEHPQQLFDQPFVDAIGTTLSGLGERSFDQTYANGRGMSRLQATGEAHALLDAVDAPTIGPAPNPYNLTKREHDVLRLLVDGRSDRQIANVLFISHDTAKTHARNLRRKLGAHSRSAAVALALREHIV